MKALTIEELEQFGRYEFLYISVTSDNLYRKDIFSGYYMLIQKDCDTINFQTTNNFINLWYSDYGKTWLAYRNKEEYECKGELVELPCKVGDIMYKICPQSNNVQFGDMWDGYIVERPCQRCPWQWCKCEGIGYDPDFKEHIIQEFEMKNLEKIVAIMPYIDTIWFKTKEQAAQKLKELRGAIIG